MNNLTYNKEQGLYLTDTGLVYERVSHFLERFTKPFPADMIAAATAKRDGITVAAVKAKWQEALDKGDSLHRAVENTLKGLPIEGRDSFYANIASEVQSLVLKEEYYRFESEEMVQSDELRLCGTADIVGYRSRSAKSIVDVSDVKGNLDKFTTRGDGKYFLGPISHLEYCYYNRTALQASLYMYMEEVKGNRPGACKAYVIDRNNPDKVHVFHMPYLKSEINAMVDYAFPVKS